MSGAITDGLVPSMLPLILIILAGCILNNMVLESQTLWAAIDELNFRLRFLWWLLIQSMRIPRQLPDAYSGDGRHNH